MKKFLITIIVAGVLASPTFAAYYVAGDFQGWDPGSSVMTETSPGSGIWTEMFGGLVANSRHEFKITQGDWSWNFPGANSWLYADPSGNITITYDANTYSDGWSPTSQRIGLSSDPGTWTAAGDFEGWNNAAGNMTSIGGGVYEYSVSTPGSYNWKAVVTGTWDSISWDNRSVGTANWGFTVSAGEVANLYVNGLAGTARIEIVPEPSALALLGCGLAGLFWLRRRQ